MTPDREANPGPLTELLAPLLGPGRHTYGGEVVTVSEHLLQSAQAAEAAGEPPSMVVAALFHDLGWLLDGAGPDVPHEILGAAALARHFGHEVVEPVRLHVAAKRYLCATDPDYLGQLSDGSRHTLATQGGPMSPTEAAAFASLPFAAEAVGLRRYDDLAKEPGRPTPDLDHFVPTVVHQFGG